MNKEIIKRIEALEKKVDELMGSLSSIKYGTMKDDWDTDKWAVKCEEMGIKLIDPLEYDVNYTNKFYEHCSGMTNCNCIKCAPRIK